MYAFLWRLLPGPLWLRIILAIVLVAILLYCLVAFVFPWVSTFINAYDATVEE